MEREKLLRVYRITSKGAGMGLTKKQKSENFTSIISSKKQPFFNYFFHSLFFIIFLFLMVKDEANFQHLSFNVSRVEENDFENTFLA